MSNNYPSYPGSGDNPYGNDHLNGGSQGNDFQSSGSLSDNPFAQGSYDGSSYGDDSYGTNTYGDSSQADSGYGNGAYGAYPNSYPNSGNNEYGQPMMGGYRPGVGMRFGGFFLDFLIVSIISGFLLAPFVHRDLGTYFDAVQDEPTAPAPLSITLGSTLVATLVWFIYRVLMEHNYGGTLGKKAIGARVVSTNGGPLTMQQAFIRNSWYVLYAVGSLVPGVSYIFTFGVPIAIAVMIGTDKDNRHITDKWAIAEVVDKSALYR